MSLPYHFILFICIYIVKKFMKTNISIDTKFQICNFSWSHWMSCSFSHWTIDSDNRNRKEHRMGVSTVRISKINLNFSTVLYSLSCAEKFDDFNVFGYIWINESKHIISSWYCLNTIRSKRNVSFLSCLKHNSL